MMAQHIEKGDFVALGSLDVDENIQKIIKMIKNFDPFSIVKIECLNFDKLVVILKLRNFCNTSNTKLKIDFTCKVPPFDVLHHIYDVRQTIVFITQIYIDWKFQTLYTILSVVALSAMEL